MTKFLKPFMLTLAVAVLATSCVSKKKFTELTAEKDALQQSMEEMRADMESRISDLESKNSDLSSEKDGLSSDLMDIKNELTATQGKVSEVEASVAEKQSQIDAIKGDIASTFSDLESAVASNGQRIKEVEGMFYLDMSDNVNFKSGSNRVGKDDKETLQELANMLNSNPNVTLIVEGHTDKKQIKQGAAYKDNWDLSVARATAVVRELLDLGVNPEQLVAAGRGEFSPSASADDDSKEALAANRRTEFVLIPNVGKLYKMYKSQKP